MEQQQTDEHGDTSFRDERSRRKKTSERFGASHVALELSNRPISDAVVKFTAVLAVCS